MVAGIYGLKAPLGDGLYIGSSKDVDERMKYHLKQLHGLYHPNRILQSAFNKYGELSKNLLLVCEEKNLLLYEQAFIDFYNPRYNISKIAGRVEWTPELRSYFAKINTGKVMSEETRQKQSLSLKGKPWTEKRKQAHIDQGGISEETRAKLSKALKGIKRSPETIEKMRKAQQKWRVRLMPPWTEERRAKFLATRARNKGKRNVKRENPDCN